MRLAGNMLADMLRDEPGVFGEAARNPGADHDAERLALVELFLRTAGSGVSDDQQQRQDQAHSGIIRGIR